MTDDIRIFSPQNLLAQAATAPISQGYHTVEFYVDENGRPAKEPTERLSKFYLSPSGGALRDEKLNIVLYSAKYDKYKGYGKSKI
ncbi:hypothetical protein MASR2M18_15210 [Ignavibacteria bacterium]|jgi:hypothetical protein|nr:hypothetical protein [Bacteroidota bacterium]MCZ2132625.1 hypothetical protein [Bacteroidota bacterium]